MTGLVTLGEAMLAVSLREAGPLFPGATARLSFAGAEATVAIGVRRQGHRAAWTGVVGADAAATMILTALRAEGVDTTHVRVDPSVPTGLMLRQRRTSDHILASYYRKGQAGAGLRPEDIDPDLIAGAGVLHVTGITPALGPGPLEAVRHAVAVARTAGTTVSLDVNYRSMLWSPAEATAVLRPLAQEADIVFAGLDEAGLLVETAGAAPTARALAELGPRQCVIKLGADGALALVDDEVFVQAAVPVTAVDPIGAGDSFVAGYLSGLLDGADPAERLRTAAICGAFSVSVPGDWEGLPHRTESSLLTGDDIRR
ncbi:2-dehydro-3-deoxygluconokinase [Streptomyces sp. PvR006]|uniref:sugar kinase n=1 Tax=unclassified Streptomyces TaxID=2593676 RepID=UPI001AE6B094|nr:sugar kinase [Streptomyces sp. PvR006]MBP2586175.1 2-dehydro-3-deoxygluconokinase [Streptomyces sp. PvR006]